MITTTLLAIAFILTFVGGFAIGIFSLLGYMMWRLMSNLDWDKSNMTNALRVISHLVLHPNDFFRMYYMTDEELRVFMEIFGKEPDRPLWYVRFDEITDIVKSRPRKDHA